MTIKLPIFSFSDTFDTSNGVKSFQTIVCPNKQSIAFDQGECFNCKEKYNNIFFTGMLLIKDHITPFEIGYLFARDYYCKCGPKQEKILLQVHYKDEQDNDVILRKYLRQPEVKKILPSMKIR